MERTPLYTFVDFVLAGALRKLPVVKDFKEHRYDHAADFYGLLREAIVEAHEKQRSLEDVVLSLTDERKRRLYQPMIAGYLRFLGAASMERFTPPHTVLPIGDLEVDINPEIGLEIAGTPHVIKLHFGGATLAQARIDMVLGLMIAARGPAPRGTCRRTGT